MKAIKMSKSDGRKIKQAKRKFRQHMIKLYPDFTPANWAKTSWRINNPQYI